ncbi:copper resistance protein B [Luteimonas sp. e5]
MNRCSIFLVLTVLLPGTAAATLAQHVEHATPHATTQSEPAQPVQQMHAQDHQDHREHRHDADLPVHATPHEPIPAVTAADRAAAFPPVGEHHKHGTSIHSFSLLDRMEYVGAEDGDKLAWSASGWVGGDIRKLWWRSEGHAWEGRIEDASVELMYGRGVRAWWDVVAGVRHDFGQGADRTWLGIGVQGFAPYKFDVATTLYVGQGGRAALRAEAGYDTLLTNRLILQWHAEADAHGKDDPTRGIGRGLSSVEIGLRLRYEIRRQFAPYVGIEHARSFGTTADLRRAHDEAVRDTSWVAGLRLWF